MNHKKKTRMVSTIDSMILRTILDSINNKHSYELTKTLAVRGMKLHNLALESSTIISNKSLFTMSLFEIEEMLSNEPKPNGKDDIQPLFNEKMLKEKSKPDKECQCTGCIIIRKVEAGTFNNTKR